MSFIRNLNLVCNVNLQVFTEKKSIIGRKMFLSCNINIYRRIKQLCSKTNFIELVHIPNKNSLLVIATSKQEEILFVLVEA
jgi:hypothetical protein